MKISIEDTNNGYIVIYDDKAYVFRSVDDLMMLEDVAKRFLKRNIKVTEK